MRFLKWFAAGLVVALGLVVLLYNVGGYLFEGPWGPIPGGALAGPVTDDPDPDWSGVEEVIELEIRPEQPWSLSVWAVVVDGELYTPSKFGESRPWPPVIERDPRVRVRTRGKIYERNLVRVTDPEVRERVARAQGQRYGEDPDALAAEDTTWFFHYAPRS